MRQGITIVGSYMVGLFMKGERIPMIAETVIGREFYEGGGGKGSNQAVAAAKLGGDVRFVGRIGRDRYGDDALKMYAETGVAADGVIRDDAAPTGVALILVDRDGNNSIMVTLGANDRLTEVDIDGCAEAFAQSAIVAFQLENRLEIVDYGIRKAHAVGATVLLDPAPARPLPADLYPCIDIIKPNEVEAATLSGIAVTDFASAEAAGRWFLAQGVKTAIITLGAQGAVAVDAAGARRFTPPRPPSAPVDSTGAGDTFSGALMAALSRGEALDEAIRFAIAAATLSVTKPGVIESIPTIDETRTLLNADGENEVTGRTCRP